ncbi:MAG: hypothetical protein D6736_19195 [Nitrospinota bacterium]|nr:MAG: hypothetical protein D6736_19195 [Nitrospinota bacterium]
MPESHVKHQGRKDKVRSSLLPRQILAGGLLLGLLLASITCLFPWPENAPSSHPLCWVGEFMLFPLFFTLLVYPAGRREQRISEQVSLLQIYKPPR